MADKIPAGEKLLFLIRYCLIREWVTSKEVAIYLDCTTRQAVRLMRKLHDIQWEIGYIYSDMENSEAIGKGNYLKIRVRLDRKYGK
jgi:hypothetical protein